MPMARQLSLLAFAAVFAAAFMSVLPPCSAAATTADSLPVPASAAAAAMPAATTAAATGVPASKKFPLAPPEVFEPAAEVVSALPVPVPETLPSAEGLGFGSNNGLGCCGGVGYNNGFGYNNNAGPLFFNSAPPAATGSGSLGLLPLLLACAAAAAAAMLAL
ncbi:uncharacterized protein LOC106866770 [Brachypodium distachyon]|uniref:uncharacterized protein LOC106866770 n=1 Tax=Brachypodium distachyon TaxID=15368 RepID=UPI00071E0C04|nr:uncharacterized protein LOC106866770 [Brachypodium distachyon]|eukprot:XP_014758053.1 uncharacterized protein LOC106866770 [Brachypodium distachyon]